MRRATRSLHLLNRSRSRARGEIDRPPSIIEPANVDDPGAARVQRDDVCAATTATAKIGVVAATAIARTDVPVAIVLDDPPATSAADLLAANIEVNTDAGLGRTRRNRHHQHPD